MQAELNSLNQRYREIGIDLIPLMNLFKDAGNELSDLKEDGARLSIILNDEVDKLAGRLSSNSLKIMSKLNDIVLPDKD